MAVISNGTAVLGLGNIGALASKPVMEGKGVLFKNLPVLMYLISKLTNMIRIN
ncbi:NADP-dependent malic enzyme (NADP-ME) [Actinobacillus equuli]|nr:NADP-dependent malic enzyme (NADP-ME) [Actinobacillus equuli]